MEVSLCRARQAVSSLRPRHHQPSTHTPRVCQRRGVVARAEEGGDKKGGADSDFEALFARELQRRGLSSTDSVDDARPQAATPPESSASKPTSDGTGPSVNPFKASSTRTRAPPPPKAPSAQPKEFEEGGSQREKSMALVTEGLEGLIPRASELLKLGGSLFLAFLPFMLAFSVLFTAVFLVWGDSFLHGGRRPAAPPRYIDPMELLSEPTVDPYIPFDRR